MTTKRLTSSRRVARGFTLIELVIAMAMVAILASIALPAYNGYIKRGQLAEAFTTLADMRVKLEQYYQDNKFYGVDKATATCATLSPYGAWPVATKYFRLECAPGAAPSQTYTLTAFGIGGLTKGNDYTLTEAGIKGTAKFDDTTLSGVTCWRTKTNNCDN